jgi:parallel beta-helix repeat protein
MNTFEEFTSIQGAIDDTDTVNGHWLVVYNSKCIHERITVNKSLTITGEPYPVDSHPIIDGRCGGDVITITADGVTIENLVIENYEDDDLPFNCGASYAGIQVESNNNIIRNNEIRRCPMGVYLYFDTSGNKVYGNKIDCKISNFYAIMLAYSSSNELYCNEIINSEEVAGTGISLNRASSNRIYLNEIKDHSKGIYIALDSDDNDIIANKIEANNYGIYFECPSDNNRIHHNNFLNNTTHAYIFNTFDPCTGNQWDNGYGFGGNYWSGYQCVDSNSDGICENAYSIPGSNNPSDEDNYPLASQWQLVCGNVDGSPFDNYGVNVGDAVYLIYYLYHDGPPPVPWCSGDVNGDGEVDDDDIDYLLDYIYYNGPSPVGNCCPCTI